MIVTQEESMIHLAVIGPGAISHRFMEGMKDVPDAAVTAFISRRPENCASYAAQYGVTTIGSLDDILTSGSIDAAYISSPNHVHAAQIRACLEHGIHVLCEKPVTITASEYLDLLDLAHQNGLVLMEAQKALYTPVYQAVKDCLERGELGTILSAEAGFCRNEKVSDDAWRMTAPGKGALYDVGCYPLSVLHGLFGCSLYEDTRSEQFQNDTDVCGTIHLGGMPFPIKAEYSVISDGLCGLNIHGTAGSLSCPSFWKAASFTLTRNGKPETISFSFQSEFSFETIHFLNRIRNHEIVDPVSEKISEQVLKILQR